MTKEIIQQDQAAFVIISNYTVRAGVYLRLDNENT
jgi:hypothetical protein